MKSPYSHYLALLVLLAGISCAVPAVAQDATAGTSPGATASGNTITPQDKMKLFKVRRQVLEANPDLKAEAESLKAQREALKSQGDNASPEDKKALLEKSVAHQKKMREAILKEDPSLEPVMDQMEQQAKEKFQQRQSDGA